MNKKMNWLLLCIATVAISGILGWAGTEINKVSNNEIKIDNLEKSQVKSENKLDVIYWYMIERNGIEVPKKFKKKFKK